MSDRYDFDDYDDEELLERREDVWDSARAYGEELIGAKYKYSAEKIAELEKTRRHFLEMAWAMDEEAEDRGLDIEDD